MEPRISLITLAVAELERAAHFYGAVLKLPRVPMPAEAKVAFFEMGHTWLSLFPRSDFAREVGIAEEEIASGGRCGVTLAHNLGSIEALDALFAELKASNAKITRPPHKTFWGGYSAYFKDPDDFLWELAWNPQFPHV